MEYAYGYRSTRGGLKEALETRVYISEYTFKKLLCDYNYYTFDKRCNEFLFILKKPTLVTISRFWLFIEIK